MVCGQGAPGKCCDLPYQTRLGRIDVCLADPLEVVFAIDDIERAVVGERGHSEPHEGGQRRLIVERST